MKYVICLVCVLGVSPILNSAIAQTPIVGQSIICDYDDAGNRVMRRVIQVGDLRLADTTSTEEIEEPPIEDGMVLAYPNPTNGNLNIGISPNLLEEENGRYIIVDLSGREVSQGPLTESLTTLDISNEANGNYILTVFVGERREEWQIVKN